MSKRPVVDEPLHPIQVVARRTGLSQDAIRVWERRYGAVTPLRTGTNRRLYSEEEIDRLLLMRRAVLAGRAIRDVACLDSGRLAEIVADDEAALERCPGKERAGAHGASTPAVSCVPCCLDALDRMDIGRLKLTLRQAAMDASVPELVQGVVVPFMRAVGDGWERGALSVAQEHLASSVVRSMLHALLDAHERAHCAPAIVVAAPPGQKHELGALVVAVIAALEGWKVAYLGPDLPFGELACASSRLGARAVALSFTPPAPDADIAAALAGLKRELDDEVSLFAGGTAVESYAGPLEAIGARLPDGIDGLRCALRELR